MVTTATPIGLIAGLGNPGSKYEGTRHNAGFWFADALARRFHGQFRHESRFHGDVCKVRIGTHDVWLIKPETFMNLSGQAVQSLARFYRIPVEGILVAHDDLDLEPGIARLKKGGGHGGHNGLRDLNQRLGKDYRRLRLGIGHPGHRDDVTPYVLGRPSQDERIAIENAIDKSLDVIEKVVEGDYEKAMNALHSK